MHEIAGSQTGLNPQIVVVAASNILPMQTLTFSQEKDFLRIENADSVGKFVDQFEYIVADPPCEPVCDPFCGSGEVLIELASAIRQFLLRRTRSRRGRDRVQALPGFFGVNLGG